MCQISSGSAQMELIFSQVNPPYFICRLHFSGCHGELSCERPKLCEICYLLNSSIPQWNQHLSNFQQQNYNCHTNIFNCTEQNFTVILGQVDRKLDLATKDAGTRNYLSKYRRIHIKKPPWKIRWMESYHIFKKARGNFGSTLRSHFHSLMYISVKPEHFHSVLGAYTSPMTSFQYVQSFIRWWCWLEVTKLQENFQLLYNTCSFKYLYFEHFFSIQRTYFWSVPWYRDTLQFLLLRCKLKNSAFSNISTNLTTSWNPKRTRFLYQLYVHVHYLSVLLHRCRYVQHFSPLSSLQNVDESLPIVHNKVKIRTLQQTIVLCLLSTTQIVDIRLLFVAKSVFSPYCALLVVMHDDASLPIVHNKVKIRTLLQTIVLCLLAGILACQCPSGLTLHGSQSPSLCTGNARPEDFLELFIRLLYPDHVK